MWPWCFLQSFYFWVWKQYRGGKTRREANQETQLPRRSRHSQSRVFLLLVNVENFGEYVFKLPCHLIPKAGLFLCVLSDTYGPACLVQRGCRCPCCAYVMWPSAKTCVPPLPKATPLAFVWSAGTDRFSCYQNSCSNHTSHVLEREDDAHSTYQDHPAAVFSLALSSVTCSWVNNQSGA